jgi:hypothetical protein
MSVAFCLWGDAMIRFAIAAAVTAIFSFPAHADFSRLRKGEPSRMQNGERIIVADRTCGTGYRQVTMMDDGTRERRCVKFSPFPPEIILR